MSKLSNYTVHHHIGEGAFGEVSLAVEKESKRTVAIKAVSIKKILELNKERHIMREKELLTDLKHPNIIELYTTFKDDKNLYFVFEVGQNGTLDDLIKATRGKLTEPAIRVMFA